MGRTIFAGYEEASELPDGYVLRYPGDATWAQTLVAFIIHKRACCPFFAFELVFELNHGAIWLHLTGDEDVKASVQGMIARVHERAATRLPHNTAIGTRIALCNAITFP